MMLLTKEQKESVKFVKKNLKINMIKEKKKIKLWANGIIQVNIEVMHIAYVI